MQGVIEATAKLDRIARDLSCIANGQIDYIKYGNCWKIPTDWKL